MPESKSVKAILSAEDKNFTSTFRKADSLLGQFEGSVTSGLGFGVLMAAGQKCFNAISNGFKEALNAGMGFEAEMSKVAAIGSTKWAGSMDAVKQAAKAAGASTIFTATEAGQGLEYMAMAGWDAERSIGALEPVLKLAAAAGEDLGTTSDIVTDAMTAFNVNFGDTAESASEAVKHFTDILAAASSNANTNVSLLGESFKYVAPVAGALGYQVEDTAIALGLMANAGIKGGQAGTMLRQAINQMIKPSKEASGLMEEFGISLYDSSGNAKPLLNVLQNLRTQFGTTSIALTNSNGELKEYEDLVAEAEAGLISMDDATKMYALSTIFGARSTASMLSIINASDEDFQNLATSIYGADGAAEEMYRVMNDNLQGAMSMLGSATEALEISFYETFGGKAKDLVFSLADTVSTLNSAFNGDAEAISKISPLLKRVGAVGGSVMAVLGTQIATNSGLFKGIVFELTNSQGILKTFGRNAVSSISSVSSSAMDAGKSVVKWLGKSSTGQTLSAVAKGMTSMGKQAVTSSAMFQKLTGVFSKFSPALSATEKAFGTAFDGILSAGGTLVSGLTSIMGAAMHAIMPAAIIGAVLTGIGFLRKEFGSEIDSIINMVASKGPEIIKSFGDGIAGNIPLLIAYGSDVVIRFMKAINENIPALFNVGTDIITRLVTGVATFAPQMMEQGFAIIGSLIQGIATAVPQLLMAGMTLLVSLSEGIAQSLPTLIASAAQSIGSFIITILGMLPEIADMGIQIVTNLANGILNGLSEATGSTSEVLDAIVSFIQDELPEMFAKGFDMIGSFAEGLMENLPEVLTNVGEILSQLLSAILSAAPGILQSGFQLIGRLAMGLLNNLPSILNSIAQILSKLFAAIIQNLPKMVSTGFELIGQLAAGLIKALPKIVSSGVQLIGQLLGHILQFSGQFVEAGWNFIMGMVSGIVKAAGNLVTAAVNAVKGAFNSVLSFLGIHSPSKKGEWSMKMLLAGDVKGVKKNEDELVSAYTAVAKNATKAFEESFDSVNILPGVADQLGELDDITSNYSGSITVQEDADYSTSAKFTVEVPLYVNSREFARATATDMSDEISKRDIHSDRRLGILSI